MRLNSLFWRFFSSIFMANLLVMAITSYIAIATSEEILRGENHDQLILNTASFLIERYENKTPSGERSSISLPRFDEDDDWGGRSSEREPPEYHGARPPKKPPRRLRMAIYTDQNEHVYGRIKQSDERKTKLSYVSPNTGQTYHIVAVKPKLPHQLSLFLGVLNSIRFILLLIASAVVSFLLSLLITRPLKQLGEHTEQLAQGHFNTSAPRALLKRGDEVGDLARQLNDMGEKLDALINSKQQLLHDVSHELRAPLARLQVASALLNPQDQKHAKRIERECERMSALIQNILDYARLGESEISLAPLNVSELISQCVQNIQFEYAEHAIYVTTPSESIMINADADKLFSAIENIMRNACKYTEQGTRVDVTLEKHRSNCLIVIRDYGKGVADAELEQLSKPFYRANNRMHGEGFGLGLSIAQRAIEQHGGKMQLDNHIDGGLQVTLSLPFSN